MTKAMYPGSFDPLTFGHLDVIRRASKLFDELVVVIMVNPSKELAFSAEDRLTMIHQVIADLPNVTAEIGSGLSVDYAKKLHAQVLIRGIRAVMDYEYELQQATANMILAPDIETVFLLTKPEFSFMSSSSVKQIALNHGNLSQFVPAEILPTIKKRFKIEE